MFVPCGWSSKLATNTQRAPVSKVVGFFWGHRHSEEGTHQLLAQVILALVAELVGLDLHHFCTEHTILSTEEGLRDYCRSHQRPPTSAYCFPSSAEAKHLISHSVAILNFGGRGGHLGEGKGGGIWCDVVSVGWFFVGVSAIGGCVENCLNTKKISPQIDVRIWC